MDHFNGNIDILAHTFSGSGVGLIYLGNMAGGPGGAGNLSGDSGNVY